jgi:hypothetical protein
MMGIVKKLIPQRTVIGTVIEVFRFSPRELAGHQACTHGGSGSPTGALFACTARCMANDDGDGTAQQYSAY